MSLVYYFFGTQYIANFTVLVVFDCCHSKKVTEQAPLVTVTLGSSTND